VLTGYSPNSMGGRHGEMGYETCKGSTHPGLK
jgi:hypothetical protein